MNSIEFEQFVLQSGKDILRFCRMISGSSESGDELYQDTMLKLLEKLNKIDSKQNVKSYAISVSILLWKNKKKKYATRKRIASISSLEEYAENGEQFESLDSCSDPEHIILRKSQTDMILEYLYYSANMKLDEIAEHLHIPLGTVKTRIRKSKAILKERLEALGYDE